MKNRGQGWATRPKQATITTVLQKINTALPSYSVCANWLQGAGPNAGTSALQTIPNLINQNSYGHATFNTSETAALSGSANKSGNPTNIPSSATFTVNDVGAFFNASDLKGRAFRQGPRGYSGNSLKAQSSILIHEIAHVLTVAYGSTQPFPFNEFQKDNGIRSAETTNNKLVDHWCRPLIEALK